MTIIKVLTLVLPLVLGVLGSPHGPERPTSLETRQSKSPHWYKYWTNSQADVEAKNLDGGEFSLTWDEPSGGNFVIGKGYQTGFET